jgi:hypothetical protein
VGAAIGRGWIGPELQLLGASLGGIALLAGAWYLADDRPPWSLAFGAGGAIVVVVCALATHEWLDLVGPGPAVALAALATVASTVTAWQTRQQGTGLVAGVVAVLAPIETLDQLGEIAVLGWQVAVILGATALGLAIRWRWVRLVVGWLGALVLLTLAFETEPAGSLLAAGLVATAVVAAALWLAPAVSLTREGVPYRASAAIDARTVAAVPAWVWLTVAGLLDWSADGVGIGGCVAGLAFCALAGLFSLARRPAARVVAESTVLGGLGVLAVGLAIWLNGPVLAVALMAQALITFALGRRLDDLPLKVSGGILAHVSLAVALVEMLQALDGGYPNPAHAIGTLLVIGVFAGAAALTYPTSPFRGELEVPFVYPFVVAWACTMLWFTSIFVDLPQGLTFVSGAWAAMACGALVVGLLQRNDVIRITGLVTLGITLLKLFTVDLAEVDVFWRVGLFFVVGVGFIALGLLVPNLVRSADDGAREA